MNPRQGLNKGNSEGRFSLQIGGDPCKDLCGCGLLGLGSLNLMHDFIYFFTY